jgi:shikimate kinase
MKNKIIYLTGFMGSGKSTIGPILANTLGWDYYDLDKVIEEKEGKKVREIFEKEGEKYFRDVERKTFKELSQNQNLIISLGGGTLGNKQNLDWLKNNGKLIYLKISPDAAYERLKNKRDRPMLTPNGVTNMSKDKFMLLIKNLLSQREKFYEQSDIIIDTDNISIGKTVDKIAMLVKVDSEFS